MRNNTSFPLPLPFVLPLLHHPIYLCVALSGFPHSAAPGLSGPIRGRICIDLQPPVPGALLLPGTPTPPPQPAPFFLCPPSLPRACHRLPGQLTRSVRRSPFVTNCQRLAGQ